MLHGVPQAFQLTVFFRCFGKHSKTVAMYSMGHLMGILVFLLPQLFCLCLSAPVPFKLDSAHFHQHRPQALPLRVPHPCPNTCPSKYLSMWSMHGKLLPQARLPCCALEVLIEGARSVSLSFCFGPLHANSFMQVKWMAAYLRHSSGEVMFCSW